MAGEIVNKVAQSGIEQIDLKQFKSGGSWKQIDLKDQLWNEMVLREKEFRAWVKEFDWSQFEGEKVFI